MKIEDLSEVHIWVSRVILIDLIPEDILLLITFETEIVLAFSSPDMLVQDDARDSVFDIKVDKLLVGTNLEAVDLVIGTVASVPQMALVRDCSQLKSVRADERIYILATLDGGVIVVVPPEFDVVCGLIRVIIETVGLDRATSVVLLAVDCAAIVVF